MKDTLLDVLGVLLLLLGSLETDPFLDGDFKHGFSCNGGSVADTAEDDGKELLLVKDELLTGSEGISLKIGFALFDNEADRCLNSKQ